MFPNGITNDEHSNNLYKLSNQSGNEAKFKGIEQELRMKLARYNELLNEMQCIIRDYRLSAGRIDEDNRK